MAFRKLMAKLSFEKITVKALAEEANINRKTFYLHYDTMDDLLLDMREMILSKGIGSISMYEIPKDLKQIISDAFAYMESLPKIDFQILRCAFDQLGGYGFSEQLKKANIQFSDGYYENNPLKRQLSLMFITNCILRFFYEWRYHCTDLCLDDVVSLTYDFIRHGVSEPSKEQLGRKQTLFHKP